jgi:hypothetical protein
MTNQEAAKLAGLTVRQVQRVKKKYEMEGLVSLVHGNTGRKPAFAIANEIRETIAGIAEGKYRGTSFLPDMKLFGLKLPRVWVFCNCHNFILLKTIQMPQIIPRAFFAEFASENAGENGFYV